MQQIVADHHIFSGTPYFSYRVYTNSKEYNDYVITSGPILYEINRKHILAYCDLRRTSLKDCVSSSLNGVDQPNITINIYFTYKKRIKESFLLVKIDDCLVVLGKVGQQFQIHREFKEIRDYSVSDQISRSGELQIEITYPGVQKEHFELSSLSFGKGIDWRYTIDERRKFDRLTKVLEDSVAQASSNLATLNRTIQKKLTECNKTDSHSDEDLSALTRYGDIWLKNFNDELLIGIPVYNSSDRKFLAENIRVALFDTQKEQLLYTHKIYEFHTANGNIEPIRLQEIYDENDPFPNNLMFDHEWQSRRKYILFPETAAVIVVRTSLVDFQMKRNCTYDIFIRYNVHTSDDTYAELQLHAGSIPIDTDILQDQRYLVSFDANSIFKDLLAVIASTELTTVELQSDSDILIGHLQDLLVQKFRFDKVSTNMNVLKDAKYFLSSQLYISAMENHVDDDHRMFYFQHDGYWNGTLIRVRMKNETNNETDNIFCYEMKIYNRHRPKVSNLLSALQNEFGRQISLKPTADSNTNSSQLELKYQFREETSALEQMSRNIASESEHTHRSFYKFIDTQRRTDTIWVEMLNKK